MLMSLRCLFGFLLACLAAGIVTVLFVTTPLELASGPAETLGTRTSATFEWALLTATHAAIFSAVFALIAIVLGEWLNVQSLLYYVLAGVIIALLGFYAQFASEAPGQPTVLNGYALMAFASAGFAGGLIYYLISGRYAGRRRTREATPHSERPRLMVEDAEIEVSQNSRDQDYLDDDDIEDVPVAADPSDDEKTRSPTT